MSEDKVPIKIGGIYEGFNNIKITIFSVRYHHKFLETLIELKNSLYPERVSYIRFEDWDVFAKNCELRFIGLERQWD